MHHIEPFYRWVDEYNACEDKYSPFYGRAYSESQYTHSIYNYLIHPQWDEFGSETLFMKILYVDYPDGFAVLEFIGEWNDAVNNDIMQLKTEVLEVLLRNGIRKFLLLGERVLNFHPSDDCYYEDWFQDVDEGWIVAINFRDHVREEWSRCGIDQYVHFGGELDEMPWQKYHPTELFRHVDGLVNRRLTF